MLTCALCHSFLRSIAQPGDIVVFASGMPCSAAAPEAYRQALTRARRLVTCFSVERLCTAAEYHFRPAVLRRDHWYRQARANDELVWEVNGGTFAIRTQNLMDCFVRTSPSHPMQYVRVLRLQARQLHVQPERPSATCAFHQEVHSPRDPAARCS